MELLEVLMSVEIFDNLTENELSEIGALCQPMSLSKGMKITEQGTQGEEMYIIAHGFVEVKVTTPGQDIPRQVVNLGPGQLVGEMVLVDRGLRSATTVSLSEHTVLYKINHQEFEKLCSEKTNIGYKVMRNIASDLSFKLRHQNLQTE